MVMMGYGVGSDMREAFDEAIKKAGELTKTYSGGSAYFPVTYTPPVVKVDPATTTTTYTPCYCPADDIEDLELESDFVDKIIFSGPKTIVFWADGTKTIVGCAHDEPYDKFDGFCAALAKKLFGSTSQVKKIIKRKTMEQK